MRCLRRSLLGVAAALLLAAAPLSPARAALYALVIGVDDYAHIPKLRGAVNDALDISEALKALPGAEVTLLLDEDATRARILDVWGGIAARARAGDTIVVTFAGHGSSEPAAYPETETDGRDETLLLAGFESEGPGAAERLRDDEIAEMIARTPDAHVIFVADACHSGTATRASTFDLSYRFYAGTRIADDPLPPPPPPPPGVQGADLGVGDNQTFFGAVGDSEKAPEIPISGHVRGALSYAFADGVRGGADRDGDGVVSKGELEVHIRRFVKQATAGKQRPKVAPLGQRDMPLFRLDGDGDAGRVLPPFARDFDDLPPLPVRSEGAIDATPLLQTLDGVRIVTPDEDDVHTLIVNLEGRELRSVHGDQLRRLYGRSQPGFRAQIQELADKLRGVQAIQQAQLNESLDVWLPYGDELYFANDPVRMSIDGRTEPYVSILNLPSDGTVEWLYPILKEYQPQSRIEDPESVPPAEDLSLDVVVLPPFGSDHIVVIETPDRPDAVWRALARHNLGNSFRALWTDLHFALRDKPHTVAVHAFFSRRQAEP